MLSEMLEREFNYNYLNLRSQCEKNVFTENITFCLYILFNMTNSNSSVNYI